MNEMVVEISPVELQSRMQSAEAAKAFLLLDVRQPEEVARVSLESCAAAAQVPFLAIPLMELPDRLAELQSRSAGDIVVYCRVGERSRHAAHFLLSAGLGPVFNLDGGINAFARDCGAGLQTY